MITDSNWRNSLCPIMEHSCHTCPTHDAINSAPTIPNSHDHIESLTGALAGTFFIWYHTWHYEHHELLCSYQRHSPHKPSPTKASHSTTLYRHCQDLHGTTVHASTNHQQQPAPWIDAELQEGTTTLSLCPTIVHHTTYEPQTYNSSRWRTKPFCKILPILHAIINATVWSTPSNPLSSSTTTVCLLTMTTLPWMGGGFISLGASKV